MSVKLQQITNLLNQLAPKNLAADWDNIGLQLGDYNQEVKKVLVSLDINQEILQEAKDEDVDLIIAHHPLIFDKISKIRFDTPLGKIIQQAIKAEISIYIAHTNYDIAPGGLNDILAAKLELNDLDILDITSREQYKKLVVFVPQEAVTEVKAALGKVGAGWIGNYSDCFFEQQGIGSFRPLDDTTPYSGEKGKINQVNESRLETIVPSQILGKVIKELIKVHPYEEVAYDIYPVENEGEKFGLGRIGYLEQSLSLQEYVDLIKERLALDTVRIVGDLTSSVKKVALCSGSGADYIKTAAFKGADLLVTGDLKYHQGQLAQEEGLAVVDAGHYGTEKIMEEGVVEYLTAEIKSNNLEVEIIRSKVNTNPFQVI
ncbi:Nif3-like dinuclear metal center hexameric protein [Natroniella sulfidigena]|uniref:Nif3-like dinuclear metal center hexameric protein n=1 Tax=Natroniella sulfidigena TaxID=723921 RepID=UPI00200AD981|nr:Nif3-like dinuclear metal center hexameric protein [Natroniella sulfidigena]MCK8815950.1 Nif3-like dinuclear metal center hexameric protein [Natroniella sulfidigena]